MIAGLIIGFVIGFVVGALVFHNNQVKGNAAVDAADTIVKKL
jgi:hypothetical protein